MWSRPRETIRVIVHHKPVYGVFYLATLFALQENFFYANWWSFGLTFSLAQILVVAILSAPFIGLIWLFITGWIYGFTGRWLGGRAPTSHLRAAIAWSKLPTAINLLMWLFFLAFLRGTTFIHEGEGPSSALIVPILTITSLWSLILLVQSIREVQGFTLTRSLANIILASLISTLLFFFAALLARLAYVALPV